MINNPHILSFVLFSPLLALLPVIFLPASQEKWMKGLVAILLLIPWILSVVLFVHFRGTGDYEFMEILPWMTGYKIYYRIGVDGFSLPLVVLTTSLLPLVVLQSWQSITTNVRGYLLFLIMIEVGLIGVFVALDLFLFYTFWEAQLIPMYFLIGIWGGQRRIYATMKFVLYTMAGSLLMLAAILYVYFAAGQSFNVADLQSLNTPINVQLALLGAFLLAFAIKVPLFPFHTWLPDAHVEAPTGGSMLLAAVLLKMGTYGMIRFALPIFPEAALRLTPLLMTLSVIGIIYGSLVSMVQPDLKKLVAYSSVAHMGFVVLGFLSGTAPGITGASLQMINHGISTGALFLLVGMIYERRHTRMIADFGGIAKVMPLFTVFFLIVSFSSIGLPGTNGFVGEFLILVGTFKTHPIYAGLAATGVVFGAAGMLWMIQRVFFGPLANEANKSLKDISGREIAIALPFIIMIFLIGFFPTLVTSKMDKSVQKYVERIALHGRVDSN